MSLVNGLLTANPEYVLPYSYRPNSPAFCIRSISLARM
jgi:hypothetical protein